MICLFSNHVLNNFKIKKSSMLLFPLNACHICPLHVKELNVHTNKPAKSGTNLNFLKRPPFVSVLLLGICACVFSALYFDTDPR